MVARTFNLVTVCLGVLCLLGIAITLFGLFAFPVLPYFQLDVVLTAEELRDQAKKQETLELLQKAQGNQAAVCIAVGLFITACGALGLYGGRAAGTKVDLQED